MSESLSTLKEQGNAAFKNRECQKSCDLYTQALALDDKSEAAASLFSNRAASYTHLAQFDLALLDANSTIKLRPTWSRGYARRAEAFSHLQSFDYAHGAYKEAERLGEDEADRTRYAAAALAVKTRQQGIKAAMNSSPGLARGTEGSLWPDRLQALQRNGFVVQSGSAVELAVHSYTHCQLALKAIDDTLKKLPDGQLYGQRGGPDLANLAGCMIGSGKDPSFPLLQKIQASIEFQIRVFGCIEQLKLGKTAKEIIGELDQRRKREGWSDVRQGFTSIVKGSIIGGFLLVMTNDVGRGLMQYRFALSLLEEGNIQWASIPFDDKGNMHRYTFLRSLRVMILEAIEAGHFEAKTMSAKRAFKLTDILTLGQQVLDDCSREPPMDYRNPFDAAYMLMPIVRTHTAMAYAYYRQGLEKKTDHGPFSLPDATLTRKAAECKAIAANRIPKDHPDRPILLYHSLGLHLRAGGLTIRKVFALAAEAEAAMALPEPVFGPTPRNFENRLFCREQCSALRDWLETPTAQQLGLSDPLEAVVMPIPTVDMSTSPRGKDPKKMIPNKVWSRLPGHVALAEFIGMRD